MSSVGSDNGPDDQGGGGPLPTQFDELNADYSSSTLSDLIPTTTLTGSDTVNSWMMNGQTLFGDSDYFGDFFVNASGSSPLGLSIFHPLEDPRRKGGSHCSSDGTSDAVQRCQTEEEEDPSFLIAPSPDAGSDADYQPAQQIPNFPGSSPLFGSSHPSVSPSFGMVQNGFAMTWPSGVIQGTFPLGCCDVTLPVVGAPTSDSQNPNSDPAPIWPGLSDSTGTAQGGVPEIPQWAMLLIGFAGLALAGRRRYWRWGATRSTVRTP